MQTLEEITTQTVSINNFYKLGGIQNDNNDSTHDSSKNHERLNGVDITETIEEMFHRLVAHEAHHKGQLFVYARMLSVVPPFYVDLSV